MVFILLGLVCMVILPKLNYTGFWHFTTVGYLVGIGLILWVFAKGEEINGAKRWFQLGPISFQVAEAGKSICDPGIGLSDSKTVCLYEAKTQDF